MTKLRTLLDTYARNFKFKHWPRTVLEPLEEADRIVDAAHTTKAGINVDRRLAPEGKDEAREKAGRDAMAAVLKWHVPRLAGLDADLAVHRTALIPPASKKLEDRQIDFLLSRLRDRTPEEVAVFYNAATDDERRALEAASASAGRIPMKLPNGALEWRPLLSPEVVEQSTLARAKVANPEAVKKFEELREIREMHITVARQAAAEIREAFEGYKVD